MSNLQKSEGTNLPESGLPVKRIIRIKLFGKSDVFPLSPIRRTGLSGHLSLLPLASSQAIRLARA
jgi:hypothetical protein